MAKAGLPGAAVGYSVGTDFHMYIMAGKHPTGEVVGQKLFPILLGAQGGIGAGKVWKGEGGWTHQSGTSGAPSCWPCSSGPQLNKGSEMFRKEEKEYLGTKESAKCSQMPKKSLRKKRKFKNKGFGSGMND